MLLTIDEVCKYLRASKTAVRRWEKYGLTPIRINERGDRRYTEEIVQKFLETDKK